MSDSAIVQLSRNGGQPAHHQDDTAGRIGMWLFLFSELMLFGVMFIVYAVFRSAYSRDFHSAAAQLNLAMGSFNTFVLITSSLTMVLGLTALQRHDRDLSICMLLSTIGLGCLFLINKFFEWREKFSHGLFPGMQHLEQLPPGQQLFFQLYFVMTGIHGLHVMIGVLLLGVMLVLAVRGRISAERFLALDNCGLYWHLVDVIWIFLLPLFYVVT